MGSADLLLHPVRLRIVQALLGGARLTTTELRQRLADVPAATLYRQVTTLIDGQVLDVVAERKVRGAVERTLALRAGNAHVGPDEARAMSVEDHRQAFTTFAAALMGAFDRYLDRGDVDLARDLVGYGQVALHLTDEEMAELLGELQAVVAPRAAHEPGQGRTPRILTTIVIPSHSAVVLVSHQSLAGASTSPAASTGTKPCCWPDTASARILARTSPSMRAKQARMAATQSAGSCSRLPSSRLSSASASLALATIRLAAGS